MLRRIIYHLMLLCCLFSSSAIFAQTKQPPDHFKKIMIVMFENMSYAEIKDEPTFKRLIEYTGNELDENGRLHALKQMGLKQDANGNGYAFFSQYYNNHSGGNVPSRPSQPNYIALISGSTHNINDDEVHDIQADNLMTELNDAGISWKVYAEDLPTSSHNQQPYLSTKLPPDLFYANIAAYQLNPNLSEEENDHYSHQYYVTEYHKLFIPYKELTSSACYIGGSYHGSNGYQRKHEPVISFKHIQEDANECRKIVNSAELANDVNQYPDVSLYIPNQINDGHNGELDKRVINANRFLSAMMGTDPKTGHPLPNASEAPFQKFMANDGLLIITFDEPSVTGNPDKTIYTLAAGNMISSGAYPDSTGNNSPICYPSIKKQDQYKQDKNGAYTPYQCNHYNLLKLIENNWHLRGLAERDTSTGYKYAYSLDQGLSNIWKS